MNLAEAWEADSWPRFVAKPAFNARILPLKACLAKADEPAGLRLNILVGIL